MAVISIVNSTAVASNVYNIISYVESKTQLLVNLYIVNTCVIISFAPLLLQPFSSLFRFTLLCFDMPGKLGCIGIVQTLMMAAGSCHWLATTAALREGWKFVTCSPIPRRTGYFLGTLMVE